MPSPDYVIDASVLSKSYHDVQALDSVSLRISRGELFGLIGPDGAGKTTLFRLLATLLTPDSGDATVDGLSITSSYREIRARIGYMPGRFSLYPDLSVEENIRFFAALFGVNVSDNYDSIAPIYRQLEPFRRRRAGRLSGGMKQKLALCCALIHQPSVLLLDEPTTGVDAVSRSEFWDLLADLKRGGMTILVSTPYMDEARRCDRIALIHAGHLLGVDTPRHLIEAFDQPIYALSSDTNMYGLLRAARCTPEVLECYPCGSSHHLVTTPRFDASQFATQMSAHGFGRVICHPIEADIEDVFIRRMTHD